MPASVPRRRSIVREGDVISGRAVRSRTWLTGAEVVNWCLGQGDVLVPSYDPDQAIAAGASKTFKFRVTPNGRAVMRAWQVFLLGDSRGGSATITAGATSAPGAYGESPAAAVAIEVREPLTAKSAVSQDLTLTIANGAGGGVVRVSGISCNEFPRAVLDTADLGMELTSEWAREPIDSRTNNSLGGLFTAAEAMCGTPGNLLRRVSYLAYARPDNTTDCWGTTSAAFSPLLIEGHILTRKLFITDNTGPVRWYFRCSASDAATSGLIQVSNNAAGTSSSVAVNLPGVAWGWYALDVANFTCEDLSQASGLVGGVFGASTFTVSFRATAGVGSFFVSSICAEEP